MDSSSHMHSAQPALRPHGRPDSQSILFGAYVAVFLTITGLLCSIVQGKAPASPDKTIRVSLPADTYYLSLQNQYADAYKKLHPGIRIEPVYLDWDTIWQDLEIMLESGDVPDVAYMQQAPLQKLIAAGYVEPLDKWIASDSSFDAGSLYSECMDEGNWDNTQYALPQSFSTVCLWYNRNLFDQAHLAYPTGDWTHDDLIAAAKKLTRDIDGDGKPDYWGFFTDVHWNRFPAWIWQCAGEFTTPDMLHSAFDSPATVQGFRWLADLYAKHNVMPLKPAHSQATIDIFFSGHLAMIAETRHFLSRFFGENGSPKSLPFDWDVAELPHGARRATVLMVDQAIIPASLSPERKKMAWDYLKFLSSDAGQEIIANRPASLPASRKWAEKAVLHPGIGPSHDHAFIDSLAYARYPYHPFPADEALRQEQTNQRCALVGDVDAKQACEKIAASMNAAIADYLAANPGAHLPVKTKWVPFSQRGADIQSTCPCATPSVK